jgi:hypothetical protein
MPGPAPKRSDQRRRRNKVDIDKVELDGLVSVPELGIDRVRPMVADFYRSLAESGQARYFEPSDWQRARLMCWSLDKMLKSGKPSAMLLAALQKDMDALLVSEPERRRVHMEIERGEPDTSEHDAKVAAMDDYRRMASSD